MKKLSVVCLLLTLCSVAVFAMPSTYPYSSTDAPFGMRWGESLGDVCRDCIKADLEIGEVIGFFDVIPPEPSFLFENYRVEVNMFGLYSITAKSENDLYCKSDRGTKGYFDVVEKARKLMSDDSWVYFLLTMKFGEPTKVEDNLSTLDPTKSYQKMFDCTWENELIRVRYYAYLDYDSSSSSIFNDTLEECLSYTLKEEGQSRFGKLQMVF